MTHLKVPLIYNLGSTWTLSGHAATAICPGARDHMPVPIGLNVYGVLQSRSIGFTEENISLL
jgi:hypothetical protein